MHIALPWSKHVLELDVSRPRRRLDSRASHRTPRRRSSGGARRPRKSAPVSPLRLALTPDDQIAVVVDETLQNPALFLVPILEHLGQADIASQAITLVCHPPSTGQAWLEDLPDEFAEVRLEVHDPTIASICVTWPRPAAAGESISIARPSMPIRW